ncbi:23S rRNA (guanosine(2251)-2'-O)-methyltransferase RlmB [bacterium]|nr:23S rRNA (guanosine(2251)-2'-O)-methyltransferase RlmB [bacterium]
MSLFFGRQPVLEALRGGKLIRRIFLAKETQGHFIDNIIDLATSQGISVLRIPKKQIEAMFPGKVHQGVAAETYTGERHDSYSLDDLLHDISKEPAPAFLIILDSVEDPRNLGALIRTADGAGAQAVICPKQRASGVTPVVVKASAGATNYVPVISVANLVQTCLILKKKGLWIVGADASAKDLWHQVNLTCPVALVLGGEDKGIRRLLREECDFMVRLPMSGRINSLNVSVAGGIMMYEVLRQRTSKNPDISPHAV